MKFLKYLLIIMGTITLGSCSNNDDDGIWDYMPAFVRVDIVDEEGYKLLDDSYAGIIDKDNLESEITYIYNGEKHPICTDPAAKYENDNKDSDIGLTHFYGLYCRHLSKEILFGDFYGGEEHKGEFTICWPDGTSDTISFISRIGVGVREISVNGGDFENTDCVKFVK